MDVQLEEDGGAGLSHSQLVFHDEVGDDGGVEDGFQEGDEVGLVVRADGADDDVVGDEAEFLGLWRCFAALSMTGFQPVGGLSPGFFAALRTTFRVVAEVFLGGVVVAAFGFTVASADEFVEGHSVLIDVEGEFPGSAAGWAGVAGTDARIFL